CLAAKTAEEERVARPDNCGARRRGNEALAPVSHDPAGHGYPRAPAGNEPANHDRAGAEPVKTPLYPGPPARALLAGKKTPLGRRTKAPPDEVGEIIARERAGGRQDYKEGDPGIGTPGGCDAKGDDHGLARQDRQERIQRGDEERGEVRQRRRNPELR